MISAITFPLAGLAAWAHYRFGPGAVVAPAVTVWVGWFFLVLLASGLDAARAEDGPSIAAWGVMAAGWFVSMLTWRVSANPLLDLAAKNLLLAALLIGIAAWSARPLLYAIAFAHLALIAVAFLSARGLVPGPAQRPRQFIAYSYPDIAAGIQHVCLIALGGFAGGQPAWVDRFRRMGVRPVAGNAGRSSGASRDPRRGS